MEGFIRAIFARSATFSHFYILAQLLFVGNGCANRRWVDRVSLLVDNVRFVLTWRLRDGIGGLSPGMNDQEDKAGSCCGLRRMWRYHQPLPPLTPSAVCCVHHVLPPLSKCTSQLGAFCLSYTFPASCMYTLLSCSAKRQKSTHLVCAIILECAIVKQLEWTCSQLHGFQFGHQQNLRNVGVSVQFGILKCSWQRQISNTLIHVDAA